MGPAAEDLESIVRGAIFHHIGKVGIPDQVPYMPGPIGNIEWMRMRNHTEMGYQMLCDLEFLDEALPGIRYHRERYEGHRYPFGLAGRDIPQAARILTVSDSFDAMVSDRPYRKTKGRAEIG